MRRTWGSVRFRITLGVTLLFGLTLSVASVLFVSHVQSTLVADIYAQDSSALEQVGRQLSGTDLPSVLTAPANRPGTQLQLVDDAGAVVGATPGAANRPLDPRLRNGRPDARPPLDANGNPLPAGRPPGAPGATNGVGPAPRPAAGPAGAPPPAGPPPPPSTTIVANPDRAAGSGTEQDLAVSAVPVVTPTGSIRLIAATPLDGVRQSVDALRQALIVAIPVLVALIAACAWVITGRALRPVAQLTSRVDEITATTLHERVPEPGTHDEIDQLARTMNAMLGRLEGSASQQQQFVSDASHELRTPVATIRTELEVALLHPEQADWTEVARRVLDEDQRLEQIVADLLTLARFDERPTLDPAVVGPVSVPAVVQAEAARTRARPVTVAVEGPAAAAAVVRGRPDELGRMVGHLLDNAARHATSAVAVSVSVSGPLANATDGGRPVVVVAVDDDGAGVPVEQRATVFERFGRLEAGRSRDLGGAGLGLAVVRRIAERHGGSVAVTDSPLGGARFVVTLPRATDDPA